MAQNAPPLDAEQPGLHGAQTAVVYATAFLQGLTMVGFPASATVLKGHGFTDAQYGLIFLPQLVMTIAGSLLGGLLADRLGLRALLLASLALVAACQGCLLAAVTGVPPDMAFPAVLAATGLFGLGAAPLNSYPGLLFPERADSALVALHTVLGVGLSAGPLAVGGLVTGGLWPLYPWSLILVSGALLLSGLLPMPRNETPRQERPAGPPTPGPLASRTFWAFVAVAVLYAFAEGTFANWAVVFLAEDRGVPLAVASLALSVFWAMLAAGRLLISGLLLRLRAEAIWLALPVGMIAVFLLLPLASSGAAGIALFAAAGLACSGFFPLTVGIVGNRFPAHRALTSSLLIAALMFGVGLGSLAIGGLRQMLSFDALYRISAMYPALALVIAFLGVGVGSESPQGDSNTHQAGQ